MTDSPKTADEVAKGLVDDWHDNQIRDEGRNGLYIDDIAGLQFDISKALAQARREGRREAIMDVLSAAREWSESSEVLKDAKDKPVVQLILHELTLEIHALIDSEDT